MLESAVRPVHRGLVPVARRWVRRAQRSVGAGPAPAQAADRRAWRRTRQRNGRVLRRVGEVIGGPVERRIERTLLTGAWQNAMPERLSTYLVSGLQNPVINVQSVLLRHHFIRELYDDQHDELMAEELRWATDRNRHLRDRSKELAEARNLTFRQLKRRPVWERTVQEAIGDPDVFASRWREALAAPPASPTSLVEVACGSANDYRFFATYGLAEHLDYTGIDLTEANIANAKQLFPAVDFRLGDVQQLALADRSYDWALASDLLEHLSQPTFERAIDEMCRVSRKGVVVIFFCMFDQPQHEIRPRKLYHVNRLSKDLIGARFVQHGFHPEFTHVKSMLREDHGFGGYYNRGAWSLVARRT